MADAGRLCGIAAEIRDRGAAVDPDGPGSRGKTYRPEVARLLRESYRSLSRALTVDPLHSPEDSEAPVAVEA